VKVETRPIPNGLLVFHEKRCIAGLGWHWYRPWLYPLYTPSGNQVLQEFPFDHPFHNGCFVAQHPVRCNGREANFWAVPPPREPNDEIFVNVGRVEMLSLGFPVMKCLWRAPDGAPVLDEERSFSFEVRERETVCEVTSRKTASYGDVEFPATKFGGICVRVEPQLLPVAGARIIGRHDGPSRFVAYENGRFGFALLGDGTVPWFLRDYGLASYNPTWKATINIPKGESFETRLTLVAYDGALPSCIASSR
jgi:hypothetical protein